MHESTTLKKQLKTFISASPSRFLYNHDSGLDMIYIHSKKIKMTCEKSP